MPSDDENRPGPSDRVWRALPSDARTLLQHGMAASDLRTLLLDVAAARAQATRPSDVLTRWRQDRLVRPSSTDPRRLAALEARLWEALPDDVEGVELSPVAPLGTVAAVSDLSQHRVVTTTRLTEVVSDSTNVLAVEAAARRSEGPRGDAVHLATIQRQLRAQVFGRGAGSHFRLFALVSSGRDTGSGRTEAAFLVRHLSTWQDMLARTIPHRSPRVEVTAWDDPLARRMADTVLPTLRHEVVPVVEDPSRERGRGYYAGLAVKITADGGAVELGDGGLTTWTAQLLADKKERCLVSCLATERLADLTSDTP